MHEAHAGDAALVASQLLAFLKEPARYRPHYLHRHEPLPQGSHVLRFAHGKFPHSLLRDLSPERRERLREAALAFIRQVCLWEGATHYQVLCVGADAKREAIKENYHLLMALIHPDRQDASADSWPADSAQRVNRAYNILGDEQVRRDYDAGLRMLNGEIFTPTRVDAERAAAAGRVRRRERMGLRFAKALLILTAMAGTLLLLEVWVSDVSGKHSFFHGAFTGRSDRNAAANGEKPRYLGVESWWRALGPSTPEAPEPVLPPTIPARPAPAHPLPAAPAPSLAQAPAPLAAAEVPPPALKRAESVDASAVSPARSAVVAQAAAPAEPARGAPSAEAIEIMVARLVGYYEAGETDKLMELLDANETSYWQTLRLRQAYLDFFRATRQRKLRVNRLAWQTVNSSAHATGEATVFAEYFDAPGTLERKVDVEMDIALRDGHAKITRLSLFPGAR
jgi:DnaJ-like protein